MCVYCQVPLRYPDRLSAQVSQVTEACYRHILAGAEGLGGRGTGGRDLLWGAGVYHPGAVIWMIEEFSFSVIKCGSDMIRLL